MKAKVLEKEQVLALRRKGLTYREILQQVPIAKSSVSLWLKDFPLTKTEKSILSDRKNKDMTRWRARAGASLRRAKDERNKITFELARTDFKKYISEPFFQVGVALYWAEGSKRSDSFSFINSDLPMTKLMIAWIERYLTFGDSNQIRLRVFTHKAFEHEHHEQWWSRQLSISMSRFGKTIFKTQNGLIVKKRPNYKGCIRIELGKVVHKRRMDYWQQMLIEYYGKQG